MIICKIKHKIIWKNKKMLKISKILLSSLILFSLNTHASNDIHESNKNNSFENILFEKNKTIKSSLIENPKIDFSKKEALPVEKAFKVNVNKENDFIRVDFDIQPEHYLYLPKIKIKINNIEISDYEKPAHYKKHDIFYGDIDIVEESFFIKLKNVNIKKIEIEYQGCAANISVCYPLIKKVEYYDEVFKEKENVQKNKEEFKINDFNYISKTLETGSLLKISIFFLLFGLLVSFTPCILPTLPIISTIIMAQNKKTKANAFKVSSIYVFGNATAYTIIGVVIALMSFNIQASLQNPFVIMAAIAILALLYISLYSNISISLPNKFSNYINDKINKISNDNVLGVFLTGFLSTLIISTCMAVPLAASIMYIGSTGNVLIGAISMFSFGIGSGLLLILISTQLNNFKIKNMKIANEAKYFMAYLISIAIALMIERLSNYMIMNIFLVTFTLFYIKDILVRNYRNLKISLTYVAFITIITVVYMMNFNNYSIDKKQITEIKDISMYSEIKESSQKSIIKFTADWCSYCVKMENEYLNNDAIKEKYSEYSLYKVDLTNISDKEQLLMNYLNVYAPPTIIVINEDGFENKKVGYLSEKDFNILIKNTEGNHQNYCSDCKIDK